MANLAEVIESQGIMLDAGILQHLKFAMRSMSVDIQREATRGMLNETDHQPSCLLPLLHLDTNIKMILC